MNEIKYLIKFKYVDLYLHIFKQDVSTRTNSTTKAQRLFNQLKYKYGEDSISLTEMGLYRSDYIFSQNVISAVLLELSEFILSMEQKVVQTNNESEQIR